MFFEIVENIGIIKNKEKCETLTVKSDANLNIRNLLSDIVSIFPLLCYKSIVLDQCFFIKCKIWMIHGNRCLRIGEAFFSKTCIRISIFPLLLPYFNIY